MFYGRHPLMLDEELRQAASEKHIDLSLPQNALLVCRKDPQEVWIQTAAKDYMTAQAIAAQQSGFGPVYALSADRTHGLMRLVNDKLQPIRVHVRDSATKEFLCGRVALPEQDLFVEDYPPRKVSDGMISFGGTSPNEITCLPCRVELSQRWSPPPSLNNPFGPKVLPMS